MGFFVFGSGYCLSPENPFIISHFKFFIRRFNFEVQQINLCGSANTELGAQRPAKDSSQERV